MIRRNVGDGAGLKVAFKTAGCRLNQAETAVLAGQFVAAGHRVVGPAKPCDVYILHTCTVTANAERDCLRLARAAARRVPPPLVVLCGCAVEADREGVRRRTGADLVLGQAEKERIVEFVEEGLAQSRGGRSPTPNIQHPTPNIQRRIRRSGPVLPLFRTTRALVKVQDGCDFGCAYCIVPTTRSRLSSRPIAEVVEEIRGLVDGGFREVVLTGANVGCYQDGNRDVVDLVATVEEQTPVERVRLSSIECSTVERRVIDFMANSTRLCRSLHLPLQSGDDDVLAAMGRRYDAAAFRHLVEYAAARVPDLGLGTDLLVGFPGETPAAFERTRALVEALPFSNLHVFSYSPRPGTRAAQMTDPVPRADMKARAAELIELGHAKRRAFAQRFVGRPVSVLVERIEKGIGRGWTSAYIEAEVPVDRDAVNTIVEFVPDACRDGVLCG